MKTLNKNERIEMALNGITDSCGQLMMWMRIFERETSSVINHTDWETIDGIAELAAELKEEGLPF